MEARVAAIVDGRAAEQVWRLEHPALYTAGTSAADGDLLDPRFPIYRSGRGASGPTTGRASASSTSCSTSAGAGAICAVMCSARSVDDRAARQFGITGERRAGRVGVWVVDRTGHERKIAAVGVRVRRWVTYHGVAFNVAPVLDHFAGIVPCGISDYGVTSLRALGIDATMDAIDAQARLTFDAVFGTLTD